MSAPNEVFFCAIGVAGERFGLAAGAVREVLGPVALRRVPLAPPWVAGIAAYRGEVLTTLSLRTLMGRPEAADPGCVVVLEDPGDPEPWGLVVDTVQGVIAGVLEDSEEPGRGHYRTSSGLIARLDPLPFAPGRLGKQNGESRVAADKGAVCVH